MPRGAAAVPASGAPMAAMMSCPGISPHVSTQRFCPATISYRKQYTTPSGWCSREVMLLVVLVTPLDAAAIDHAHQVAVLVQLVGDQVAAVLLPLGVDGQELPAPHAALAGHGGAAAHGINDSGDLFTGPLDLRDVAVAVADLGEAVDAALLVGTQHAEQPPVTTSTG